MSDGERGGVVGYALVRTRPPCVREERQGAARMKLEVEAGTKTEQQTFDEAMADWFRLGASMATVVPDGRADGPYGRAKCRHQEAAEIMTANLNRLRREKREAERAAK